MTDGLCFRHYVVIGALAISLAVPMRLLAQGSPVSSPRFSFAITGEKSSVKTGAQVWVDAVITNNSDHDLLIYKAVSEGMDQGGWVYRVDVGNAKGVIPPETQYAKNIGAGGSGGYIPLHAGETVTHRVNVSKLYDLSQPGTYTIQLRRFDEETKTFVLSNKIRVTVTP